MSSLNLKFIVIGEPKEKNWRALFLTYETKLKKMGKFEIKIIFESRPISALDSPKKEAEKILIDLKDGDKLILFDEKGEDFTSEEFAKKLDNLLGAGGRGVFVIGGPYGLHESLKKRATKIIALSKMTFTHEAAAVMALEQIYRAQNIIKGTGYHH